MDLACPVTPETVSAALRSVAGLVVTPKRIKLERRGWRWAAYLPEDLLVFIPNDEAGAARLAREGRLLQLLAARVSFGLPHVWYFDSALRLQIRSMVPGVQVGGDGREPAFGKLPQGLRLADDLGRALAELHGALTPAEAQELGFKSRWPLPEGEEIRRRLHGKIADSLMAATLSRLLEVYATMQSASHDLVLSHGDVWGGNLAVDLDSGALNGLFDFDDACLADRNFDFMFTHSFGEEFREHAFMAYALVAGPKISVQRTAMYHAIAAFAALADTRGKGETYLLDRRIGWVSAVCRGPIAAMALGTL
jgi:aminoglycoside phosphotransferase (APT) family kinase protein